MKTRAHLRGTGVLSGIGYLAIVALLVMAAVNLYRPLRDELRLKREMTEARTRLEELKILHPLYVELAGLDRPAKWPGLALPEPRKLSEGEVTGTARALHVGRTTQLWEIRIEDAQARLVCVSRLTLAVVPRR